MDSAADHTTEPAVRLLADLVRIPSVNPMGRALTGAVHSEAAVAEYVEAYLRKHGIDVQVAAYTPGRPNVLGFVDVGAAHTVMLEAHLDTVHAEGMKVDPFGADIVGDDLFGRGSCDTKGSLAAFLAATTGVLRRHGEARHNILIAAVADEEYQFSGARHAVAAGLRADCGIAGEPTNLRIVRAHKGVVRWFLRTAGRAAHAAYPDRGENAIYRMAPLLLRLEKHAQALLAQPPHKLLGTPSLSVGRIEGGQAVNIVPDQCRIEVDRRTLPGELPEDAMHAVRELLADLPHWDMSEPHVAAKGMDVPEESPIVRNLSRAIHAVTGNAVVEGASYATDAGIYTSAGIPTVVFGPGDIADAHTAHEHISIAELLKAEAIVQKVLSTDFT